VTAHAGTVTLLSGLTLLGSAGSLPTLAAVSAFALTFPLTLLLLLLSARHRSLALLSPLAFLGTYLAAGGLLGGGCFTLCHGAEDGCRTEDERYNELLVHGVISFFCVLFQTN
jgi:fatty acid desaturase